jgi:8-oxo-dGTP pyrophosphatase MutT (NUDIX family)
VLGSLLPEVFDQIEPWVSNNMRRQLPKVEQIGGAFEVLGGVTESLNQVAQVLRERRVGQVAHYWRDEQLGVYGAQGELLGSVERGAVRPLGVATRAVHLVGRTPSGGMWVQQRSLTKANDPGQWDTLMGGMISAHDDLQSALARETQEEAGLALGQLLDVRHCGQVKITRHTDDDNDVPVPANKPPPTPGIGYMVEVIDWFDAAVPHGTVPQNQDGEVAQFALLSVDELMAKLQRDEFTLEASMILVAALQRPYQVAAQRGSS